jgi:tRNA A-37 threonylcarbamoyl transferase component Bud32
MRICKQCRQPLPENAPEGLCPACLAKVALASEPTAPSATINVNPLAEAAPPTRVAPDPAQLATQFPQLEIIELLGMGGMGMVYKARQPRLDRIVALKILPVESQQHPSFAERFNREAKALAKLNHPGIVNVYDFGQTAQYYFFVMEFVDGMNLRQLLNTEKVAPCQALELVVQICTALQYAHDEGVVHRDIKPENILLNKKGQVKIADFGLAKLLGTAPDTALTMSQAAMGTLNYMAPEQRQNAQGVDHRADIYSLGVVFYEMLTGEVPMGRFEAPSKRVQVDVRLDEVVLRALEREPARRYQQVSEVKTDVESVAKDAPQQRAAPSPAGPGTPFNFAAPGSETEAELQANKLRRFWLATFGWWLLVWLFAAGMCDFGGIGELISAVAIYCLIWRTLMKRLPFIPQLSAEAGRLFKMEYGFLRKVLAGYLLTGLVHLIMLLPILMILNAAFGSWEILHWPPTATTASAFESQYTGREYRLLRKLNAFADKVPDTELRPEFDISPGRPGWPLIALELLAGFGLLQFPPWIVLGWGRARFSWAHYWRPWLAFFGTMTGSGLVAFVGLFTYSSALLHITDAGAAPKPQQLELRSTQDVDAAQSALGGCFIRRGFFPCSLAHFSLDAVPKGARLGQARLLQYWKPNPFDRWRFTWRGVQRTSPFFVVQLISSEKPAESLITVDVASAPRFASAAAKDEQALLDAVDEAVKSGEHH